MMARNSYHDDPFDPTPTATHSFVSIPVQASTSQQGSSSSSSTFASSSAVPQHQQHQQHQSSSSSSSKSSSSFGLSPNPNSHHYQNQSGASPSSTQTYRFSTSVEAGDYRPLQGLGANPSSSSFTSSSSHAYMNDSSSGHRSSRSVTKQPSHGQLPQHHQQPLLPQHHLNQHQPQHHQHHSSRSLSMSGLHPSSSSSNPIAISSTSTTTAASASASAAAPSSSSSSTTNSGSFLQGQGAGAGAGAGRTASIHRMNNNLSPAASTSSTSSDVNMTGVQPIPSWSSPRHDAASLQVSTQQQSSAHFRASPSLSSASALMATSAANEASGGVGMRRGNSYDGTTTRPATMYSTTQPPSQSSAAQQSRQLQNSSLLPTTYRTATSSSHQSAPPPMTYSPMQGVQQQQQQQQPPASASSMTSPYVGGPRSPAHSPLPLNFPVSPSGHSSSHMSSNSFSGTGIHQSGTSRISNEHTRNASYSPSNYSTNNRIPASAASPNAFSPPAPSFYANHIPASSSISLPTGVPAPPRPASHSPQPPAPPRTPSHQPQAQQYYQSQQYYESTLRKPNNSTASTSSTSPLPPPSSSSSVAGGTGINPASMFYAGNHDFRASAATAPPAIGGERVGRGLRRVRDVRDIKRSVNAQPSGRRADPNGGFVSPLKALTLHLPHTYHLVNPSFRYETSLNPRRVLTKPSKPAMNDGFDNEDSDYILYVNDVLGPEDKDRYLILDVLGQGTFGQVVKCQNMKTHEIVAVKVVKNKPAYFQQSMMEVTILEIINNQWDKDDEHHMLRLKDTFIHHSHLCLVFELLSNNLYELIKQNSFRGLSTSLVRVFTTQLLDALTVLHEAKIIHCDLKPENILLKSLQSPTIKVIDFGSACHEKQTVYTYIQSRFYRSPEVILSLPYSSSIDMWSLGCICVELFLGLPLFPGTSEFNQITRIVEMLGVPPNHMLDKGKQTSHFFESISDEYGQRRWRLKSLERYSQEYKVQEQPSKKYFAASTLPEIIKQYPIVRKGLKETEVDKEMRNRHAFIDFVKGLLNLDPEQRWTPQQARLHPFVLGEALTQPFVPPTNLSKSNSGGNYSKSPQIGSSSSSSDAKRYGGLPAAPTRTGQGRVYDAKSYGQHLQQQQGYNLQAQQAAQRAAQIPTNPYVADVQAQAAQAQAQAQAHAQARLHQQQQQQQQQQQPSISLHQTQHLMAMPPMQASQQQLASAFNQSAAGASSSSFGYGTQSNNTVANPPAAHHYTSTRGRSNTGGTQELPPALQKLSYMALPGGTGQSVTPVLRRDDQWQAFEQQLSGTGTMARRTSVSQRHPHLNLLQEQAENAYASPRKPTHASQSSFSNYYTSPHQGQPPAFSVVVDGRAPPPTELAAIAAPPLAYASNSARYAPYSTGVQVPNIGTGTYDLSFDAFGNPAGGGGSTNPTALDGLGVYPSMQPFGVNAVAGGGRGASTGVVGGPQQQQQQQQQSLYSSHVPFSPGHQQGQMSQSNKPKQW